MVQATEGNEVTQEKVSWKIRYKQIPGEAPALKGFKLATKNEGQSECRIVWTEKGQL